MGNTCCSTSGIIKIHPENVFPRSHFRSSVSRAVAANVGVVPGHPAHSTMLTIQEQKEVDGGGDTTGVQSSIALAPFMPPTRTIVWIMDKKTMVSFKLRHDKARWDENDFRELLCVNVCTSTKDEFQKLQARVTEFFEMLFQGHYMNQYNIEDASQWSIRTYVLLLTSIEKAVKSVSKRIGKPIFVVFIQHNHRDVKAAAEKSTDFLWDIHSYDKCPFSVLATYP